MCRLSLIGGSAADLLGREFLEYHFAYLEKKQGGDGMGVAALYPDGRTRIRKSVDMGPREAANTIIRWRDDGADVFIFHTRLATHGTRKSANCHPFRCEDTILAHNGVDDRFEPEIDRTDSETILKAMVKANLPTEWLEDCSGVFVGFRGGTPFVVKGERNTSLLYLHEECTDAWMFASDAPQGVRDVFSQVTPLGVYTWLGYDSPTYTKKQYSYKWWQSSDDDTEQEQEYRISRRAERRRRNRISPAIQKRLEKEFAPTPSIPTRKTAKEGNSVAVYSYNTERRITHIQTRELLARNREVGVGKELSYDVRLKITDHIRENEAPLSGLFTRNDIGDISGLDEGHIIQILQTLNYLEVPLSTEEIYRYYRVAQYSHQNNQNTLEF